MYKSICTIFTKHSYSQYMNHSVQYYFYKTFSAYKFLTCFVTKHVFQKANLQSKFTNTTIITFFFMFINVLVQLLIP